MQGRVASLQICPGHRKPMQFVESLETVQGVGIKGDLHALPGSPRQVLLIELETLQELQLIPGGLKENITTQGLHLSDLKRGSRLAVGTSLLFVTGICHPCSRLDEVRPGLRKEIEGRRGMLARISGGGIIHVGDSMSVI